MLLVIFAYKRNTTVQFALFLQFILSVFFFLFIFLFALFFAVDSLFIWCSFSLDNVFYAFFFIFLFLWLLFEPLLGYVGNVSGSLSREDIECFVFVVRRRITWLTVVLTKQGPVLCYPLIREVRTREK